MRFAIVAFIATSILMWSSDCDAQQSNTAVQSNPSESGHTFSVMTWNLEWFYDDYSGDNFSKLAKEKSSPSRAQWDWRRDAVAAAVANAKPSILAVQEIESRRVLWYLSRALDRNHKLKYQEYGIEGSDHYTEQDVGFLCRAPVEALSVSRRMQTAAMKASERFYNLSKHLIGEFQVPVGDGFETVTIVNLHLRAREEVAPIRIRQARLAHQWIKELVRRGENVIVLGDLNTEEMDSHLVPGTDLWVLCGGETEAKDDDLTDITMTLPTGSQDTHLLGKRFDRILVSRALLADDPSRADLVLGSVEVRKDLAIQGNQDLPEDHWDRYWQLPANERDLSDHYPVMATFEVR